MGRGKGRVRQDRREEPALEWIQAFARRGQSCTDFTSAHLRLSRVAQACRKVCRPMRLAFRLGSGWTHMAMEGHARPYGFSLPDAAIFRLPLLVAEDPSQANPAD